MQGTTRFQSTGWLFNIQRFSTQDGPGIRTTVFLKGCPLRCQWCSNAESWHSGKEILFFAERCDLECGKCVRVCPCSAIEVSGNGQKRIVRSRCNACGECVEVCPKEALGISGQLMTAAQVIGEVKKDAAFYRNSSGGVTLSGGEPTAQADFALDILTGCQEDGLHTCLDTCGYTDEGTFERILEAVDLVLFDIKHMDPRRHKEFTGVDNEIILRNAVIAARKAKELIFRVPLIPGCNDSEENIRAVGKLAVELKVPEVDLLPYHRLGVGKFAALGRRYELPNLEVSQIEEIRRIGEMLESMLPKGCKIEVI